MKGLLIGFLKLCLAVGNLIWPPAEQETPVAVDRYDDERDESVDKDIRPQRRRRRKRR